jgi:hypothetical protein
VPCSENRRPFIVVFIVAVEGGLKGRGHDGADSIFNVRLSRVLRGRWGRAGGFGLVQEFIRDLHVD